MKVTKYKYIYPGPNMEPVEEILTEEQIIREYFSYWSDQMRRVNKWKEITRKNCIEDWVVVMWAEKVK